MVEKILTLTYTAMIGLEDYGFCERGQVGAYFATDRATYGGDVVVNPHGGLLAQGYLHGLNHHYEDVRRTRRPTYSASLGLALARERRYLWRPRMR